MTKTYLKGMEGARVKAMAVTQGEEMAAKAVKQMEDMGLTVHVVTEFEFWVLHGAAKEAATDMSVSLSTDKPVDPMVAASILGAYV